MKGAKVTILLWILVFVLLMDLLKAFDIVEPMTVTLLKQYSSHERIRADS